MTLKTLRRVVIALIVSTIRVLENQLSDVVIPTPAVSRWASITIAIVSIRDLLLVLLLFETLHNDDHNLFFNVSLQKTLFLMKKCDNFVKVEHFVQRRDGTMHEILILDVKIVQQQRDEYSLVYSSPHSTKILRLCSYIDNVRLHKVVAACYWCCLEFL